MLRAWVLSLGDADIASDFIIDKATRFLTHLECRMKREREQNNREGKETDSVLLCGSLLWNICVKRIKRLID